MGDKHSQTIKKTKESEEHDKRNKIFQSMASNVKLR